MMKMTIYINLPIENGDCPDRKALNNQRVYKYIASPDHVNAENTLGGVLLDTSVKYAKH